ncbi:MAG: TatD family hydrolase [Acidobacteriota bacterium]
MSTESDPPLWTDIAANLTSSQFRDDRARVIERAVAAGVRRMVVLGLDADDSGRALELARAHPEHLKATAGCHPHSCAEFTAEHVERIRGWVSSGEAVAVGECGLDFNRNWGGQQAQRDCFQAQLDLAAELEAPLYLHERDAHEALMEMVLPLRDRLGPVVVHCFTGTEAALRAYLDADFHVGVTGWIADERRGKHLVEAVRLVPENRLMVETDAPYLLPRSMPDSAKVRPGSRRNEPAYLTWVGEAVAGARGVTPAVLAQQTTATAAEFFGWPTA